MNRYWIPLSVFLLVTLSPQFHFAWGSSSAHEPKPAKTSTVPIPASFNAVDRAILNQFDHLLDHSRIASKCLNCHQTQFRDISASLHGRAGLLKSLPEGALCLTCHEVNHFVKDPQKIQNFQLDQFVILPSDIACMRCHGDPIIAAEYNFPPHVPSEFENSIHYRKAVVGDKTAPLCADCHGAHNIVSKDHPSSPVHEAQKVKVCSKCHPGANATFASVFDHTPITPDKKPLEYWTITVFKVLTLGTFMALGLFILLDILATIRTAIQVRLSGEGAHKTVKSQEFVLRFNPHVRLQHFLMLFSVISLSLSAWPLLAPESPLSQGMMRAMGGVKAVAYFHRFAGFVMIGDFIYHVIYLYLQFRKGGRLHPMVPMPRDLVDLWHMIQFFFGLRSERPEFGQFAFHEKFDYWAVFWGVAMMGGSGLVLTFPILTAHILPGWAISLANIIHADEALLAAMVLFIWHFYNVHLKPGIFPMNWAWLTGRMRKDLYEHEHPGHVKELKKKGQW